MPNITDTPPRDVQDNIADLRAQLDTDLPPKLVERNLLIATWNIRCFGSLTRKWRASSGDSPKRDLHALLCIAEIISRFDVVAIQEVQGDLRALRDLMKVLGSNWSLSMTDITKGDKGNKERIAFLFDMRKVQLSGLACEIVIPPEWLEEIEEDALREQFARTPYAVSFRANGKTFVLVTLHVWYGDEAKERTPELKAIARWMSEWALQENAWDHNLIILGDFNIDRRGDERYEAFTSTGLTIPDDLENAPRSIFADPQKPDLGKYYDQVAWFTGNYGKPALSLEYSRGGTFDFVKTALKNLNLTKNQLSWRISDHYPLWVEFVIPV